MLANLEKNAKKRGTILCFGMDPVLEKMGAGHGGTQGRIEHYFTEIGDALISENQIAAIKPNYAYFAQYGFDGLHALKAIISRYSGKVEIILDGKRGDIGKSSEAYAKEAYDFWGADAVTISPYMGKDSVLPFIRKGKIAYALCRTSNAGAADFQDEVQASYDPEKGVQPLYEKVANKCSEWGCGLVVGATSDSIARIAQITEGKTPFLIPGIGAQGGDLKNTLEMLGTSVPIHRINASSSIAYAWEKKGGSPAKAALAEAEALNSEIREFLK
jgi:orotidine 5'-phosphate decarboxylase subfamily 2